MRSGHRSAERLAELTREVGAVLSRVDEVASSVVSGLNAPSNPNGDSQPPWKFDPEEHEELCGLAAAMLIRLNQAIGRIKANSRPQPALPAETGPSHLHLAEKSGA